MVRKLVRFAFVLVAIFLLNERVLEAEEIPKFYQVICQEPNGNNGYYKTAPEVIIKHFDGNLVTRYQILFASGRKVTGKITEAGKSAVILATVFEEGEHQLDVWMEETDGSAVAGTEQTKKMKIDWTGPNKEIQFVINTEKGNVVEIEAEDSVSGVEGIYYKLGNGEVQYLKGAHVYVNVPKEFQGKITARAVDRAGNMGTTWESGEIDGANLEPLSYGNIKSQASKNGSGEGENSGEQEEIFEEQEIASGRNETTSGGNSVSSGEEVSGMGSEDLRSQTKPRLVLDGIDDYMITGRDVQFSWKATGDNEILTLKGKIVWEGVNGNKKTMEVTDWDKEGETYMFRSELKEDGIYRISFQAIDGAGNQSELERQVIIDKTNPVIKKIQELDGEELESFQWNYDVNEIVSDFTTYTYEVRLDGVLCNEKKKYSKAGKHILEVMVTDAAGNQGKAVATFRIVTEEEKQLFYKRKCFVMVLILGISGSVGMIFVMKRRRFGEEKFCKEIL